MQYTSITEACFTITDRSKLLSYTSISPEENWNEFKNHMKEAQSSIPSKLSSERTNLPWLTTDVKRLCRKKRRQYNKAKKSKDPSQSLNTSRTKPETLCAKLTGTTSMVFFKKAWMPVTQKNSGGISKLNNKMETVSLPSAQVPLFTLTQPPRPRP